LNNALQDIFENISNYFEKPPLLIIQFGSSLSGHLKPMSDVDFLIVFDALPESRKERFALTLNFENALNSTLQVLDAEGYHYEISPILRSRESLHVFSGLYLDMVGQSRLVFDPHGLGADLLQRTKRFMERNHTKKIYLQGKPVWLYDSRLKDGERFRDAQPF
jgi:predicted nucleotidyltransferase